MTDPNFALMSELSRIAAAASVDVLHLPGTYLSNAPGGDQVYVVRLIEALRSLGVCSAVAMPGKADAIYDHDGVPVFRFVIDRHADLDRAYEAPDPTAQSVRALIARLRPQIVHLHAHIPTVSNKLADAAHEVGAKVVFTYHTTSLSLRAPLDDVDGPHAL